MTRRLAPPFLALSLLGPLLAGSAHAQDREASLRSTGLTVDAPTDGPRAFALRTSDGTPVGRWVQESKQSVRLSPDGRAPVAAPRLQRWLASADGRTLVGAGDPAAAEHPFALQVVVLREGTRVAALEGLAPESELAVGPDGTLGLVGSRAGERGSPFAMVLDPAGRVLFRHRLPADTLAREPALFGTRLLFRVHGLIREGEDGAVWEADASGPRKLLEAPGALGLVGFPQAGRALVWSREAVRWLDALDGHVLWERAPGLRPAGEHAWELLASPAGTVLGVVTAEPRRAQGTPTAPRLAWLDPRTGAGIGELALATPATGALVDLGSGAEGPVVEWDGAREALRWDP